MKAELIEMDLRFVELGLNFYAVVKGDSDYQYQLGTLEWDTYDESWDFSFVGGCSILEHADILQLADFIKDLKVVIKEEE